VADAGEGQEQLAPQVDRVRKRQGKAAAFVFFCLFALSVCCVVRSGVSRWHRFFSVCFFSVCFFSVCFFSVRFCLWLQGFLFHFGGFLLPLQLAFFRAASFALFALALS